MMTIMTMIHYLTDPDRTAAYFIRGIYNLNAHYICLIF